MDPRWRHPFTCVVAGPTGSGKTHFVKRFLQNLPDLVTPTPERIVWCYGEWQPGYADMLGVDFEEGLPSMETFDKTQRTLLILDDLAQETDSRVTKLFTQGSHHWSVLYLVQNLFDKNKEHRTISLNAHYLVLFKNPRDGGQIRHLASQMFPGRGAYLREAYDDATEQAHGYLIVDCTQQTPSHLRLRSTIFPGEYQVVYTRKSP
jgi:GTPase SAR1 family protein